MAQSTACPEVVDLGSPGAGLGGGLRSAARLPVAIREWSGSSWWTGAVSMPASSCPTRIRGRTYMRLVDPGVLRPTFLGRVEGISSMIGYLNPHAGLREPMDLSHNLGSDHDPVAGWGWGSPAEPFQTDPSVARSEAAVYLHRFHNLPESSAQTGPGRA